MIGAKWGRWSRLAGTVLVTVAATVFGLKFVGADFSPLANDSSYQQFLRAYALISNGYYRKVDTQQLLNHAIKGLISALDDPFSAYMDPVMTAKFRDMVSSHFQGIGAVLSLENGQMTVSSVLPGSPAAKAGLARGDVLAKIGNFSTANLSLERAVELIRGHVGTQVTLTLLRGGRPVVLRVTRAKLTQSTVFARMLPQQIGYILITQFSEDTANAFLRDLDILQANGAKGLIIDVRQDPGGLLQSVGRIADALLPKGARIVQIVGRDGTRHILQSTGGHVHIPMVCLIDGNSASAAEILAAALQESGHVALVGEKTYGKGTVQETAEFADGSSLKLTIARWLTPDGEWIHKKGVVPTILAPTPSYFRLPPLSMTMRRPLALNSNSVSVAVLQRMLLALGFIPGREDGYFDQTTRSAVAAFQRLHRLPVTGAVNNATAYSLNVALLTQKQRADPQLTAAIGYLQQKITAGN